MPVNEAKEDLTASQSAAATNYLSSAVGSTPRAPEGCLGDGEGSLDCRGEGAAGLKCPSSDGLAGAGAAGCGMS